MKTGTDDAAVSTGEITALLPHRVNAYDGKCLSLNGLHEKGSRVQIPPPRFTKFV
jgi:hypothetical protein